MKTLFLIHDKLTVQKAYYWIDFSRNISNESSNDVYLLTDDNDSKKALECVLQHKDKDKYKNIKIYNLLSVIDRVIQRAKHVVECDDIVLCTSTNSQDLPLIRVAQKHDIYYFNGDPGDVLKRLNDAATLFNVDYIVGITADNPLFSIRYANLIVNKVLQDPTIDYIYSTSNPIGMNMYAINTKALKVVCNIKDEIDTEIWGRLLNRPELFNVVEVHTEEQDVIDLERVTLDEPKDYEFLKFIFDSFDKDYIIEEMDLINILNINPDIVNINKNVRQMDLDKSIVDRIDNFYKCNYDRIVEVKSKIYNQ